MKEFESEDVLLDIEEMTDLIELEDVIIDVTELDDVVIDVLELDDVVELLEARVESKLDALADVVEDDRLAYCRRTLGSLIFWGEATS